MDEFSEQINTQQNLIDVFRNEDQSATDFVDTQVHAWSEQLVETFLFQAFHDSQKNGNWGEPTVQALVDSRALTIHTSEEYPLVLYCIAVKSMHWRAQHWQIPTMSHCLHFDLQGTWTCDLTYCKTVWDCDGLSMSEPILVLGAGPAGLSAAHALLQQSQPVSVIERSSVVGGLARTVEWKGYRFDVGGHRFFTRYPRVQRLWRTSSVRTFSSDLG